jgi:uroporphyrin-III C-methyltransferase
MNRGWGTVYLVGAGPGAADLLTLRAARLLAQADVVFHDALVGPEILSLAERAQLIAVGKRCGRLSTAQRFINRQLVAAAQQHAVVVRLKGGDPMMFGRAQEEITDLQAAGVPFEIVPGVSAGFAASAMLAQSLTQRGLSRNVVFVTPRFGEGEHAHEWTRVVLAADTAVIYMAGQQLAAIAQALIAGGMRGGMPAVLVAGASTPGQRVFRSSVEELASGERSFDTASMPVLLMLGAVFESVAEVSSKMTSSIEVIESVMANRPADNPASRAPERRAA